MALKVRPGGLHASKLFRAGCPTIMPTTKIVCVSDTHGRHQFNVPDGDVLIHSGDFSMLGSRVEVELFRAWLKRQPHRLKIVIAGNHDLTFHTHWYEESWKRFGPTKEDAHSIKALLDNPLLRTPDPEGGGAIVYLEDELYRDPISGLTFYGSPWQPEFGNWAFALPDAAAAAARWAKIPGRVDVLITHGPPWGVLDNTYDNGSVGCPELLKAVTRVKPRLHVFGHIHESAGQEQLTAGTIAVNASICSYNYQPIQPAREITL